ncbi:MAG: hypothetical protein U0M21_01995 [Emergencia sp.]|nr:hypothetical protein [Emergencia sp.]
MDAQKIVERIRKKEELDDEWFEIYDEIVQFLKEDHPEEEKKVFRPLGYLEMVSMMCDGIEQKE